MRGCIALARPSRDWPGGGGGPKGVLLKYTKACLCVRQTPEDQDGVLRQLCIHFLDLGISPHVVAVQALDIRRHVLLPQAHHLQKPLCL